MRRVLVFLLLFAGCAVPQRTFERGGAPQEVVTPSVPRALIVYIPQSDDSAATWLKWFDLYPDLKLVIAMSPRFTRLAKELPLRTKLEALMRAGRLELALQIPNAPILPLLLENPPYGYTDDVVQLIAQSKAGYFKLWGALPRGLVLPYGAASPRLMGLLERSGFAWTCGALGLDPAEGPYQIGSMLVWDASPIKAHKGLTVHVWDERHAKDRPLAGWMAEMKKSQVMCVLPQEAQTPPVSLDKSHVQSRTWDGSDFSLWIGDPNKNAAWNALRRTREALESYKNSGQASVARLDAAFGEIYGVQNSNFFASAGNTSVSPALVEDRAHEFQASLSTVYRMMGKPVPEDLFTASSAEWPTTTKLSSTTITSASTADGGERVTIREAAGDVLVPGGDDLVGVEIQSSSDTLRWTVMLTSASVNPVVEIYLDLNGQPNVGTTAFLSGRPMVPAEKDAWEYAIALTATTATLYRTQGGGSSGMLDTYPVTRSGNQLEVIMHPSPLRGRISRWGYQALAGSPGLSDFLDPFEQSQKELWDEHSRGNRHDIPFIRVRRN